MLSLIFITIPFFFFINLHALLFIIFFSYLYFLDNLINLLMLHKFFEKNNPQSIII